MGCQIRTEIFATQVWDLDIPKLSVPFWEDVHGVARTCKAEERIIEIDELLARMFSCNNCACAVSRRRSLS